MNLLDTEQTFLEALHYPRFAIPEFWIKKQKESGWSRETYLGLLKAQYEEHSRDLHLLTSQRKKAEPDIEFDAIGKSLESLTDGKVKYYYTMQNTRTTILNRDLLDTLHFCLIKSYNYEKPDPAYTDLQFISFARQTLFWIKNELKIQSDTISINFGRNTDNLKNYTEAGEKVYLLHNYSLKLPSPILDYYVFEDALRNLMLSVPNYKHLEKITKPLFELGTEIVDLWNNKLHELDTDFHIKKDTVKKQRRFIEFDTETRWFKSWNDIKAFVQFENKNYENYDLVLFASRVGDLAANEVLNIEESPKPMKDNPQSLIEVFNSQEEYQKSIAALRTIMVIDEANQNLVGNSLKGVMQVWIHLLRNERRNIKPINDSLLTVLLNKEFTGLDLSEKSDGKHFRNSINQSAKQKYRTKLLAIIRG